MTISGDSFLKTSPCSSLIVCLNILQWARFAETPERILPANWCTPILLPLILLLSMLTKLLPKVLSLEICESLDFYTKVTGSGSDSAHLPKSCSTKRVVSKRATKFNPWWGDLASTWVENRRQCNSSRHKKSKIGRKVFKKNVSEILKMFENQWISVLLGALRIKFIESWNLSH